METSNFNTWELGLYLNQIRNNNTLNSSTSNPNAVIKSVDKNRNKKENLQPSPYHTQPSHCRFSFLLFTLDIGHMRI